MRAKIERIAAGKFEYEKCPVTLSEPYVQFHVSPGSRYEGNFTLSCRRIIKGIVYASSSRMYVEHPSFHSRNARIAYVFDSRGMWGGEEVEGEFCIVTEAGEYTLPYRIQVEEHRELEEESYAYFISADPIEPLPEKMNQKPDMVVEIIDDYKEEDMTPEEAVRLTELILKSRQPTAGQLSRLKKAYHKYGGQEMLSGICSILIKNGRTDEESFFWYQRGVRMELKITNLFEYFMMSVPENYQEQLPRNLLLYFHMENTLNSKQKAFLYANIIRYQERDSDIYRQYEREIQSFMLEQLLERKLSEDLAFIYERFLVEELLTIDFAEALADIMFLRQLTCEDPRIRQVQVLYEPLQRRITVPLSGGKALVPVYTPGAVILLVDEQGNCYTSSVPYSMQRLLKEQKYVERCRELLRYHQGLYLHLCDGASRYHVITRENVENYKRILKISGLTARYKQEVRQEILQYYYANHELEELDREFFITETTYMMPKDRARFTEILILRGLYEEAWNMVKKHGYSMVRVKLLIKLAAWEIREMEYEENEFLLKLCLFVFQNYKYNESILEYLAGYYYGSRQVMEAIWKAGQEFELNVFDLEERLLSQMLFTGEFSDKAFQIFQDYHSLGGKGIVSRAYMTWLAYQDFVLGEKVPEKTYIYIEQGIAWEENLADVCGLAYLKYLSAQPQLSEHQRIRAEQMTMGYIQRRLRFGFMKELLAQLGKPQLLEDKTFVEYRTNPTHKVVIHYVVETPREKQCSYVAERLYPTETGVFVKEFTLFFGERLTWFVTETLEDGTESSTPDHSVTEGQEEELVTGTKYALLYEMARSLEERDLRLLEQQMKAYGRRQFLVEQFFSLK
ncbi:MAG: hypothetical protein HFI21_09135 [Lachnospiraceae bacterium]|nr:hypothetical protein [Lachnospiraceae bacterium]